MSSTEETTTTTAGRGSRTKSRTRPTRRPKGRRRGGGGSRRRGRRTTTTPTTLTTGRDDDGVVETLRLPCSAAESRDMNCLNDGQCFVVVLRDNRTPGCRSDINCTVNHTHTHWRWLKSSDVGLVFETLGLAVPSIERKKI